MCLNNIPLERKFLSRFLTERFDWENTKGKAAGREHLLIILLGGKWNRSVIK